MKNKRVSKKELLQAFEGLCKSYGVVSAGFNREAITAPIDGEKHDGKTRWAMFHRPKCGWMIVSGWKGCAIRFTRYNGYVRNRWDFLMLIEALAWNKGELDYKARTNKK